MTGGDLTKSSNFSISEKQAESEQTVVQDEADQTEEKPSVYTIDDAIEKLGFGPFQMFIFFFCGLLWTADAMEVMILSILSPAVKCEWDLSGIEEAIITSVVFAGTLFGSLCWGVLGDNFGRKTTLLCSNIVVLVAGVLSALQLTPDDARYPGYPWMLLCRFGVGFGAAGITQVGPYYIEFLPCKLRAVCTVFVSGWWAVGTMFGAALAVGVMHPDGLGWHWYLGLCAVPFAVSLLFFPFVPESARYYLAYGKTAKAEKVLKRVSWCNFRSLPEGRLVTNQEKEDLLEIQRNTKTIKKNGTEVEHESSFHQDLALSESDTNIETDPLLNGDDVIITNPLTTSNTDSRLKSTLKSFSLLFKNGMWKVTIILSFLWFGSAWLYYGNVLLTSTILQENPHCEADLNVTLVNETQALNASCEQVLDTSDYLKIMWTTGAELPGILITIMVIEFFGRKLTMAFNFLFIAGGFCLLFICTTEIVLTFFLFLIRAFSAGVFQVMFVYTPEVYPTKVRGFGLGVLNALSRIGAIVTPYVAQVLFRTSDYATITIYAGSGLVLIVLALVLPIETKGKLLK